MGKPAGAKTTVPGETAGVEVANNTQTLTPEEGAEAPLPGETSNVRVPKFAQTSTPEEDDLFDGVLSKSEKDSSDDTKRTEHELPQGDNASTKELPLGGNAIHPRSVKQVLALDLFTLDFANFNQYFSGMKVEDLSPPFER